MLEFRFVLSFSPLYSVTNMGQSYIKLSVPPIWIYIPSDPQLSPPSFGIFKSVCWYGKLVLILVLSLRFARQNWRRAMLRATDSRKRCSRASTTSTRAILSHTMTELSLLWVFVIRNLLRNLIILYTLNHFLPLPVVYVKGSRVIWHVFIFDEYVAKTKLK